MKRRIMIFLGVMLLWTCVGALSKLPFMLIYRSLMGNAELADGIGVVWHGLRLDIAMAGYLSMIPGLVLALSVWCNAKALRRVWSGYFMTVALLYSLAVVSNIGLYGYWGFPLDNTPLLYLKTSPADAMASMTLWQIAVTPVIIILLMLLIWRMALSLYFGSKEKHTGMTGCVAKTAATTVLLLLTASLILPIRGGIGTGTNHTGSVYFSSNIRLNHAAVNPVFSFMESVMHQEEIGTRYRFMDDAEATSLFKEMTHTALRPTATTNRYNVILISLESFSDTIMHIDGVTPNLNRMAEEGLHFRNFYANSFRTDRALIAIHSALPAQPTMSIMDIPRKSTSLPSIAGTLTRNGYSTTFYYGGDINYSNMRSYFMGTGFQKVVSDKDFPKEMHTGKWGVADGPVFDRMLADIRSDNSGKPFFRSIMTESSHEPFDVPNYNKIKTSPELNAFAYTDECLGRFIEALKALPCWDNTLVVIVPDHLGAYPANADNYMLWRFRVPLILTGGAIETQREEAQKSLDVIGSQTDIAATVLGMLGIDHSEFTYSKDLLDAAAPHFAFYTFPDAMALLEGDAYVIYDNMSGKVHTEDKAGNDRLTEKAKAYLQKLYDDIENIDKR